LHARFPDLRQRIDGADVLDFGCGEGYQVLALLALGARSVTGVDIVPGLVSRAKELTQGYEGISITDAVPNMATYDVIISQDSLEHFVDAETILDVWRRVLRPGGSVLVTFGPPWLAPYGAHMHFFTPVPWVHLLFPERTVMSVRSRFRDDGATRYEAVEGGLAKMTVRRFERLVRERGFQIVSVRRDTVKGLPGAGVPVLREFVTNNIAAVLQPKRDAAAP
jgi:SAM-dependent methyltransferase